MKSSCVRRVIKKKRQILVEKLKGIKYRICSTYELLYEIQYLYSGHGLSRDLHGKLIRRRNIFKSLNCLTTEDKI